MADGILIFVSLRASIHISRHLGSIFIEWFFLCCRCNVARRDDPRPQAKSARHLRVSSRKNPSGPRRSQPTTHHHTFYFNSLLSSELLCLGQLTLVLELDPQSYMCPSGHITTAVGTPIHQDHSAAASKPPHARAYPRVLLRWHRQFASYQSSRGIAIAATFFPLPFLRRPRHIPLQYQSYRGNRGCLLCRPLYSCIWNGYAHAISTTQQPILYPTFFIGLVLLHGPIVCKLPNSPNSLHILTPSP